MGGVVYLGSTKSEGFLKELGGISLKYKIWVGGCGCCGNSYLENEKGR
jgi:hypothetical protein